MFFGTVLASLWMRFNRIRFLAENYTVHKGIVAGAPSLAKLLLRTLPAYS